MRQHAVAYVMSFSRRNSFHVLNSSTSSVFETVLSGGEIRGCVRAMKEIKEGKKRDTKEDTKEMVTRWTSMGSCTNTYTTRKI
jgi:hypothetical protein